MADVDRQDIEKAIKAIQDIAIMLTAASEFVCEARILKRCSADIETNLDNLENSISQIKKGFPGKFPETLKPDGTLSKIREVATIMKGDNANLEAKCRAGELGNELTLSVNQLKGIVRDIWDRLVGKVSRYTVSDRIADHGGRIKSLLLGISPLVSNTGRIILAVVLVLVLSFVYLYFTMESDDALLPSITSDLVNIEEQKGTLHRHRAQYQEIRKNIKSLNKKELTREEKIQFLNLSMEEKKIKERIDKSLLSIEKKEKEVEDKRKRVEEIQKKSFFQKLLRR